MRWLWRWLAAWIERRLGGYRQLHEPVDAGLPLKLEDPQRVVVIGSGLAGMGAASHLAERGFEVTLLERNAYLGGKIGAWDQPVDGAEPGAASVQVEHGFHAFFRHYYNLNVFLEKTGVAANMRAIDDYVIIEKSGRRWNFDEVETTPVLNLLALAKHGLYSLWALMKTPAIHKMDAFLQYDPEPTFAEFDAVSFRDFADEAELPEKLRMVFTTFSRAFFSTEERLSMAELLKSFHFYYLSHDHGLVYDFPVDDYQQTVLAPMQRHLEALGVTICLNAEVQQIERSQAARYQVAGADCDHVILAAPAMASQAILARSVGLPDLTGVKRSQRYAVLRLWLDQPLSEGHSEFISTERITLLDALAVTHRVSQQAAAWAEQHGGSVVELHCYAVPDDVVEEAAIREGLITEMTHYFPELKEAQVRQQVLQVRDDFAAFHTGCGAERPRTETAAEGLYLAGDWVQLPVPAMLMEAAYTAGLLAANAVFTAEGLQPEPVYTVPKRGILAGLAAWRRRR